MWYFLRMNPKAVSAAWCSVLAAIVCRYASAQAVNIDIASAGNPVSSTYGAVPGQVGYWNQLYNFGQNLRDIGGNPTSITLGGEVV
jgi:hypothetical protein